LKYIKTPNMEVDSMLRKVRSDVAQNTNNYQVPWTSSSLIGEFAFNQKTETTPPIVTSSPVPNPSPSIAVVPTPKPTPSPPPVTSSPVPKPSPSIAVVPTPKPTPSPVLKPGTTLISRSTGVNYTRLRDLLAAKKWKEADEETARVMLKAAKREKEGWFRVRDINGFSCEDLGIIDRLWLSASKGKFGFSVQNEIYESLGGTLPRREYNELYELWGERIGWMKGGDWLDPSNITYSAEAPKGFLPLRVINDLKLWCTPSPLGASYCALEDGWSSVAPMSRAKACNL
jgi:hypothetical protein